MKTLTVYKPFDFENAIDAFDRDFRGFSPLAEMTRAMDNLFGLAGQSPLPGQLARIPAVDVEETDKTYVLEAELPGFAMEDVSVNLDGGTITIESKKEEAGEKKDKKKNYVLRERRGRSFSRSFKLPENADSEAINASFKNGLLTLTIGKRTEAQKKTIQIENAS
jgi:HSP20 family protein